MSWTINGQNYSVIRLGILLGAACGGLGAAIAWLLRLTLGTILLTALAAGLGGFLALIIVFLADTTRSALAEGDAHRARLRAAERLYRAWAEGTLEPPQELKSATYRVNGESRTLSWLDDDDPNSAKWRWALVHLFQWARSIHRESKGARTGLTEADLVGDGGMFYGREQYLSAIKQAKELGLVERVNGLPTRLAEGWSFTKVISYLQTAAVIPPTKGNAPAYRPYRGVAESPTTLLPKGGD